MATRDDIELVAVCLPAKQKHVHNLFNHGLRKLSALLKFIFRRNRPSTTRLARPVSLTRLSRHHGFEILIPSHDDINHPTFISLLKDRFQPTTALSLYCLQKFNQPLIDVFKDAVNYHNGNLPQYRGLKATAWSVYNNEDETGFTFHRMNEQIDRGPVLIQHTIAIDPEKNTNEIELDKALISAKYLNPLFDKLQRGDTGHPQQGHARYYSRDDFNNITRIENSQHYSSAELRRRLRAFLALRISIQGEVFRVTDFREIEPDHKTVAPVFRCSDGTTFKVTRIEYQPHLLYLLRKVASSLPGNRSA